VLSCPSKIAFPLLLWGNWLFRQIVFE